MVELHQTLHDNAGVCLWTILAMVAFIALVVVFLVHSLGQTGRKIHSKKKVSDYNKKMEQLYGDIGTAAVYGGISSEEHFVNNSEDTVHEESVPIENGAPAEAGTLIDDGAPAEAGTLIDDGAPAEESIPDEDDTPVRLFDR